MSTAASISEPINPALPACLVENPNGLVILWDMLRVYSSNFVRVGACLERCASIHRLKTAHWDSIDEATRDAFRDLLETVRLDCMEMTLPITSEVLQHHLSRSLPQSYSELATAVGEIHRVYQAEMRKTLLLYVREDRAAYFDSIALFGDDVNTAFPSSASEIEDAGRCYALEQDTACVLHLMRALERPLALMAVEFNVDPKRDQWHGIITNIEKAVTSLAPSDGDDWKERKEFFSAACKEFRYFKDAWRNHAMHARERYSQAQAKQILIHTGDFLKTLSQQLREVNEVSAASYDGGDDEKAR